MFQTSVPNVNIHLKNIFEEGELEVNRTIKDFLIVQEEGHRKVKRDLQNLIREGDFEKAIKKLENKKCD